MSAKRIFALALCALLVMLALGDAAPAARAKVLPRVLLWYAQDRNIFFRTESY